MKPGVVQLCCVLLPCAIPELFLQYLTAIRSVQGNTAVRLAELQRCLLRGAMAFNYLSKTCLDNFVISSSVSNKLYLLTSLSQAGRGGGHSAPELGD